MEASKFCICSCFTLVYFQKHDHFDVFTLEYSLCLILPINTFDFSSKPDQRLWTCSDHFYGFCLEVNDVPTMHLSRKSRDKAGSAAWRNVLLVQCTSWSLFLFYRQVTDRVGGVDIGSIPRILFFLSDVGQEIVSLAHIRGWEGLFVGRLKSQCPNFCILK